MLEVLPPQASFDERLRCELEEFGFDQEHAALLVWQGLVRAGAFVEGEWRFADDKPGEPPATLKVVGEKLYEHRYWGGLMLDLFEAYPRLQAADALTFVASGPGDFTRRLGKRTGKPVINMVRKLGGNRHDFELATPQDRELLLALDSDARIFKVEDILTSGSSVSASARHLQVTREAAGYEPFERIDALAFLLRGILKQVYGQGIGVDNEGAHYLLQVPTPRVAKTFREMFGIEPSTEENLPRHLRLAA